MQEPRERVGRKSIFAPSNPMANKRGYVRESRLVMAQFLGRSLTADEVVHHTDEDGHNNKLENLILFPSQAEHTRHHNHLRAKQKAEGARASKSEPQIYRVVSEWLDVNAVNQALSNARQTWPSIDWAWEEKEH